MIILTLEQARPATRQEIVEWLKRPRKRGGGIWRLRNELRPVDLYLYLHARFGPPNGLQNALRGDDSDNLIHWEWTLKDERGLVVFQGHNLRSEIHFYGDWDFGHLDRDQFIRYLKSDLSEYGRKMSRIRHEVLEHWEQFLNPYRQLRGCVDSMKERLRDLKVDVESDAFEDPSLPHEIFAMKEGIAGLGAKYLEVYRLSLSLRVLAPIMAETFVNLILFLLQRDDLRNNQRLRESVVRSQIDIKVQSLHLYCHGFQNPVDWSDSRCKAYHRVVNERNDLLHGNVVPSKLKTGEIYFNGKVPVFLEYQSFWEQTLLRGLKDSGYGGVDEALRAVEEFMKYVLSCLSDITRRETEYCLNRAQLGRNLKTGRIGVLLPDHIVDMQPGVLIRE